MNNVINTARQEGTEVGLKQGRSEGRAEGKKSTQIEIARSLLSDLPVERISEITGLTIDEIEALDNN